MFALSEILEDGGSVEFDPYLPLGQHFLQPGKVSNERYPISDIALPKPFDLGLTHGSAHPSLSLRRKTSGRTAFFLAFASSIIDLRTSTLS